MNRKIAIVVRSFYSKRIAALARVVLELSLRLSNDDNNVDIITTGNNFKINEIKKIRVIQLKTKGIRKPFGDLIEYVEKNDYTELHLHASLFGLVLSRAFLQKIKMKKVAYLYTGKASIADLKNIYWNEFFTLWKRIFLRNYFYSIFLPNFLINSAVATIDYLVLPSYRLKRMFKKMVKDEKKIQVIYPGANNIYEKEADVSEDSFFQTTKEKVRGKKVIIHSGLASPFRGMFSAVEVFKHILAQDDSYLLLFLVYNDDGENIDKSLIDDLKTKAKESLPEGSYLIIDQPVKSITQYFQLANAALYEYRYIGDIPECPLTLIELLKMRVPVFVNPFMSITEYIDKEMWVDFNDKRVCAKTILSKLNEQKISLDPEKIDEKFNWDNSVALINKLIK